MTTADTNAVRAGCRAACIATVAAGLLLLAAASSAAVGERTARIVTSDARPAGVYLMTRGVVGARGGAVRLSPQATGPATLSANGRYLVYEVGGSVRVPTGFVGSSSLRVHDFATGEDAFVVTGGHDPTFRSDGTLVYLQRIIRDGSNAVQYRPMQRRGLLGPAVRLGPLLQPVGELVPAVGGRALVELPTSVSQSHVVDTPGRRGPENRRVERNPGGSRRGIGRWPTRARLGLAWARLRPRDRPRRRRTGALGGRHRSPRVERRIPAVADRGVVGRARCRLLQQPARRREHPRMASCASTSASISLTCRRLSPAGIRSPSFRSGCGSSTPAVARSCSLPTSSRPTSAAVATSTSSPAG